MNLTLIKRSSIAGLLLIGLIVTIDKMRTMEIGTQFALVVLGGCVIAVLVAKFILPQVGDAVATFFYSSSAVATPEDSIRASAKLAQGDYEGAIAEFEARLRQKPDDTLVINEISRIRADKLHDPQGALTFLQQQLEGRAWTEDSAAFLMFRIVDLQLETLHDYASAQQVLEQIISTFPNTRHSANAHHKTHEVQQAQLKAAAHHRLKHLPES